MNSVWQLAQNSADWMCVAFVGVNCVAERIDDASPGVTSYGPYATRRSGLGTGATTNDALKLSRSPSLSGPIWWHVVHDTPSAASACSRVAPAPIGRCVNTPPSCPTALASYRIIGMWQAEHSCSIAAAAPGCSVISRRTPACQYGSRAALAIIEARHAMPIDASAPLGVTRPLWQAWHRSEVSNVRAAGLAVPAAPCWPVTGTVSARSVTEATAAQESHAMRECFIVTSLTIRP